MTHEWTARDAAAVLRMPTAADDKYSRGVLGVRTGSDRYPGAAVLGVEAAHRTGVGMVRYLGPERPTSLVLAQRPETVAAEGRVQAWLIGSGTDATERPAAETHALRRLLDGDVPVVVDAGALDLVPGRAGAAPVVATPHDREHARLRAAAGLEPVGADDPRAAASTAAALGVAVLLKGHRTVVATPAGAIRTVTAPTAWLATAGTGDVLAGILGALVAAARPTDAEELGPLAATAALVHGRAALAASAARSGGPVTALDVAGAVASVVGDLLAGRAH
ncbi:MAG: NAD(P)H-hydrate dehydratase [Microbacterium sp.]|nr:MAG: NAD(P)H-hydrate dehydratase [Microbacterium sp.]